MPIKDHTKIGWITTPSIVVFFVASLLDRKTNLTVSIVLFIFMDGIHGATKPFKNGIKNYHEHVLIKNILILFVVALYNHDNASMIAVNVMIVLAMLHLSLVTVYHIISYTLSGKSRKKLQLCISVVIGWVRRLCKKPGVQQFELHDNVNINIPEAVNYHEYREPLVLLSYN